MSNTSNAGGGISLGSAVFLVFLVLKLTDNVDWSWWWVTSPLWIPVGVVLTAALVGFLVMFPVELVRQARRSTRQRK